MPSLSHSHAILAPAPYCMAALLWVCSSLLSLRQHVSPLVSEPRSYSLTPSALRSLHPRCLLHNVGQGPAIQNLHVRKHCNTRVCVRSPAMRSWRNGMLTMSKPIPSICYIKRFYHATIPPHSPYLSPASMVLKYAPRAGDHVIKRFIITCTLARCDRVRQFAIDSIGSIAPGADPRSALTVDGNELRCKCVITAIISNRKARRGHASRLL